MIAMSYAKLQDYTAQILKYANSGDTSGDKTRVVGYVSLAFVKENLKKEKAMFSKEQKKTLLEIARSTIERYLNNTEKPKLLDSDPALVEEKGVFVTLYKKNGDLRGCIGSIDPIGPLNRTIEEMAIASSTQDPRFPPLSLSELKEIEIEISVLSVPRLISSADDIKMGVHGVIVKRGFNSGVFLPQVATETGWTKEEFLNNLCEHKAGLEKNAWKDKSTKLYTFTAEVFSEKDVN
jgi:AmmeMemoRadiSam system protein A